MTHASGEKDPFFVMVLVTPLVFLADFEILKQLALLVQGYWSNQFSKRARSCLNIRRESVHFDSGLGKTEFNIWMLFGQFFVALLFN
jgi:hypothetical protein